MNLHRVVFEHRLRRYDRLDKLKRTLEVIRELASSRREDALSRIATLATEALFDDIRKDELAPYAKTVRAIRGDR